VPQGDDRMLQSGAGQELAENKVALPTVSKAMKARHMEHADRTG
jgi:hypothetical protein